VLALCADAKKFAAAEHFAIGKSALGSVHQHWLASKGGLMPLSPPMYLVSFRHSASFQKEAASRCKKPLRW
jgi:hypothetical protein